MADRPTRAWRRRHPHARLIEAYRDAHEKLSAAYNARPLPRRAEPADVRAFLVKLTQANLSLRLLRVLCNEDVKPVVDRAHQLVDRAVRAPAGEALHKDPDVWMLDAINAVEEAARLDVQLELR